MSRKSMRRSATSRDDRRAAIEAKRTQQLERLVGLSGDPKSLDWEMLRNMDEVGWGFKLDEDESR